MAEPILRRVSWPALARASGRQCGASRRDERRSVLAQRRFLTAGPLRAPSEERLWAIGRKIADLYKSCGPAPSWVSDSEAS
jgi:hypothetical protein